MPAPPPVPHHPVSAQVTAIVLAGGAGSRLGGCDKALLTWRGRRFIEHIIERLQPQVGRIVINTLEPASFQAYRLAMVSDASPREGPLAGVLAGLGCSDTPFTLIVPCDTPNLSPQLMSRLAAAMDTDTEITYATCNGDAHYLLCLLRGNLLQDLQRFMAEGGRAVRHWFGRHRAVAVSFDDQPRSFINVNSPGDQKQLP